MGKFEEFRAALRAAGHNVADLENGTGRVGEIQAELNRPTPGSAEARIRQEAGRTDRKIRDAPRPANGDLIPRQGGTPARHNGQPDPSQGQGTNGTRIFRQNASGGVGPEITRKPR